MRTMLLTVLLAVAAPAFCEEAVTLPPEFAVERVPPSIDHFCAGVDRRWCGGAIERDRETLLRIWRDDRQGADVRAMILGAVAATSRNGLTEWSQAYSRYLTALRASGWAPAAGPSRPIRPHRTGDWMTDWENGYTNCQMIAEARTIDRNGYVRVESTSRMECK
jgi:hypothetical protein